MMRLGTLISLKELLEAIGRSQPKYLRILDTSFQKQSVRNYLNEHVPGALFFDLNECRDKSSKYNVMLPSPTMFENYVGNLGIRNDTHVVLYENNDSGFYSTPRVWWTFRLFGHEKVSILSGGLQRWLAGNEPVTNEIPIVRQEPFVAAFKSSLVKNLGEIWQNRKDHSFQLVDARSTECFNGQDKMSPGNYYKHLSIGTCIITYITLSNTHTCAHTHARTHARTRTHIPHTHEHTHTHEHVHTHVHKRTHTHTHTHTHLFCSV